MRPKAPQRTSLFSAPGFSLIEVLISTVILAMIIVACMNSLGVMQRSYLQAKSNVEQFREARLAFELIQRNLSQATLANYWDYYYTETNSNVPPTGVSTNPASYVRHSDLQFIVGDAAALLSGGTDPSRTPGHATFFQAPLGLTANGSSLGNLLNARGYAIKFSSDGDNRPPFIGSDLIPVKYRYRLVEFRPPAEQVAGQVGSNTIYTNPDTWYQAALTSVEHVVADNILLMILSPQVAEQKGSGVDPTWIAPNYRYDSHDPNNGTEIVESLSVTADGKAIQGTQHLLPPLVNVTLVAADEPSIEKWIRRRGPSPVNIQMEAGAMFRSAADREQDTKKLAAYLQKEKLNFYIFSANVSLRNAKWDGRDL